MVFVLRSWFISQAETPGNTQQKSEKKKNFFIWVSKAETLLIKRPPPNIILYPCFLVFAPSKIMRLID